MQEPKGWMAEMQTHRRSKREERGTARASIVLAFASPVERAQSEPRRTWR
jgi:hypothetical protein